MRAASALGVVLASVFRSRVFEAFWGVGLGIWGSAFRLPSFEPGLIVMLASFFAAQMAACLAMCLFNTGASTITSTILGVPYYKYSILGPKTLF